VEEHIIHRRQAGLHVLTVLILIAVLRAHSTIAVIAEEAEAVEEAATVAEAAVVVEVVAAEAPR
jgi:hypothetical protein